MSEREGFFSFVLGCFSSAKHKAHHLSISSLLVHLRFGAPLVTIVSVSLSELGWALSRAAPLLHRLLLWFDRLELLFLLLCLACAICCPSRRRSVAFWTCTYVFVCLCMIVWTLSLYILSVCIYTLLSLPQPPDPPVSIATGPPVVIVTITPTSLLLWRAKVCFSIPSHPHPPFVQQFCSLFFLLCFLLISVSSKMWYDQVYSACDIFIYFNFFVLGVII